MTMCVPETIYRLRFTESTLVYVYMDVRSYRSHLAMEM